MSIALNTVTVPKYSVEPTIQAFVVRDFPVQNAEYGTTPVSPVIFKGIGVSKTPMITVHQNVVSDSSAMLKPMADIPDNRHGAGFAAVIAPFSY